jgi:hypothetical protein
MLCRAYKLMCKRVELDDLTTMASPSPRDLLVEGARGLLKEAGLGYRGRDDRQGRQSDGKGY